MPSIHIPEAINIYPSALVQGVKRASSLTICPRNYMYGMAQRTKSSQQHEVCRH